MRFARDGERVAFEVLAVGDEHEGLVAARTALQRGVGLTDGGRDVGAAAGDAVGVDHVERLIKGAVIEGDGAGKERRAGKDDQADGIAIQPLCEIVDGEFGTGEPVGLHVGRVHAARGVHREHEVVAAAVGLFPAISPLGAGECGEQQRHARQVQAPARAPAGDGH